MKVGLCGLPFCGKSTVFKALVGKKTQAKTAASGKIHFSIGTLEVRDERLEKLAQLFNSEKVTHPQINLLDLENPAEQTIQKVETAHLREFDILALVIAVFSSKEPLQDFKNVQSEFVLCDLQVIQNRIANIKKEKKAHPQKEEDAELLLLKRCEKALEEESLVKDLGLTREELKMLGGFGLLSVKPTIVIANISEEQLNKGVDKDLEKSAHEENLKFLSLCAKLESEIEELPEPEQAEFRQEMGLSTLSRDKFIEICFQAQGLISFFTVVGKEARAWPIPQGATALFAAGCVHSDMERGFIRAEVINYKDFIECGSFAKAKEKGLLRLEGKEYLVQDGDIINFKFSV